MCACVSEHHWHSAKSESAAIKLNRMFVHFSGQLLQTSPWCGHGAVYCNRGSLGYRLVALVIDKRYLPCLAHHIPVPPEVKALLENITAVASKSSPSFGNSVLLGKTTSSPVLPPPLDQRSSANSVLSRTSSTSRSNYHVPLAHLPGLRGNDSPFIPQTCCQ